VYDGHGGKGEKVANYVATHLHQNIITNEYFDNDIVQAITNGFDKTNDQIYFERYAQSSGSTAVILLITPTHFYVANVGDSHIVRSKNRKASRLSVEHTANNWRERQRVTNVPEGYFSYSSYHPIQRLTQYRSDQNKTIKPSNMRIRRLLGNLVPTRVFGDIEYSPWISPIPAVKRIARDNTIDFFILASDGLWDVVTDKAAVQFVHAHLQGHQEVTETLMFEIAKKLVNLARSLGSDDDITATIVFFK